MNEYCRQMAILGHTSLQGSNAKTEAVTKTSIVLLTTLRRYIESTAGKDTAADILLKGRDDAETILNTLGIEL